MSQYADVRAKLLRGWTCGTEFLSMFIPRYSARLLEIKRREAPTYELERRPCQNEYHRHWGSQQFEWRLVRKDQP